MCRHLVLHTLSDDLIIISLFMRMYIIHAGFKALLFAIISGHGIHVK